MSGVGGLLGVIADLWDKRPTTKKGKVTLVGILAGIGGAIAVALSGGGHGDCRSDPLAGVYRPQRLQVVKPLCQQITVTVVAWRLEHDGDHHVNVKVDQPGWTNAANDRGQHGYTVIEFIPGNPRPDRFFFGQRLKLTVTKVYDNQHKLRTEAHGWIEGHPVEEEQDITPQDNKPKLAPPTEEH